MPTASSFLLFYQRLPVLLLCLACSTILRAQTDSVTISGQIKHLTPRLYRESPTVLITSSNILRAGQEFTHPAPLQPDGSFRVTVPLIYPQEEMYFNAAQISTAFLAAPGTLTIDLDADSLFVAAVPFRFGGVNAQVNQQFALYKDYEARNKPTIDGEALSRRIAGFDDQKAFAYLTDTFSKQIRGFAATRPVFPLLTRWLASIARYDAASFLYDRAAETEQPIKATLTDSLRPPDDRLLTSSYITAMNRFSVYAGRLMTTYAGRETATAASEERAIKRLIDLVIRYNSALTDVERTRLSSIALKSGLSSSDVRFMNALMAKNGEALRRLLVFDMSMQRVRTKFDSVAVDYLEASSMATAMPRTSIANLPLMRTHVRPLIADPFLVRSLDELYARETKDSLAIREAVERLASADSSRVSAEVATGIFVTRNRAASGDQLINRIKLNNPGRVIYVLRWMPGDPESQALAQAAQQLRNTFSNRDLTLLYISEPILPGLGSAIWLESIIKQKIKGEHLYLSDDQWNSDQLPQPLYDGPALLFGRSGKLQRGNAELPTDYNKLVVHIRQLLQGK